MDFNKTSEQLALEQTIEKFARNEMAPLAREADEKGEFPWPLWRKMGDLGMLGLTVPATYGGTGLGALETTMALQAAGRGGADQGLLLSWAAHMVIATMNIQVWGSDEQKAYYLPKMASGEWVGAMALTEPDAGSDAGSLRTRAELKGDHYILNGSKMFITNGPICDVAVVIARTDPDKGTDGISAFIIDKTMPGWSAGKKLDKMGLRSSPTSELIFEDCAVPRQNVLGPLGVGYKGIAFSGVNWERTILGASFLGGMEYALEQSIAYAKQRVQFGRPIAGFQAVRHRIVDMAAEVEAVKLLLYRQAWMIDNDLPCIKETALTKSFGGRLIVKNADDAVHIHGGYGLIKDFPVERWYRDVKLAEIGGGTTEIQKEIAAHFLLGK